MKFKIGSTVKKLGSSLGFHLAVVTILASSLISISCAKKSDHATLSENEYTFETPEELKTAVQAFHLSCDGPCPESAGVLLAIETSDLKIKVCTFSLVGNNMILTNRHCVPDSMAKSGAACDGKIQALFLKDGVKETYPCKSILSVPEGYKDHEILQPDYAVIELVSSVQKPVLQINTEGLKDREILKAIVATPFLFEKKPAAKLEQVVCKTHMNSMLAPDFTSAKSPIVGFKDCKIIPGNSGGPLLSEGRIKAIVQGGQKEETKSMKPSGLIAKSNPGHKANDWSTTDFGVGTNTACIDSPSLGLSASASGCNFKSGTYNLENSTTAFNESEDQNLKQSTAAGLNRAVPALKFKYAVHLASDSEKAQGILWSFTADPYCIVGSSKNIPWLRSTAGQLTELRILYVATRFEYTSYLNEDARFVIERNLVTEKVVASLPAKALQGGSQKSFTVTIQSSSGGTKSRSTQRSFNLGWCPQ